MTRDEAVIEELARALDEHVPAGPDPDGPPAIPDDLDAELAELVRTASTVSRTSTVPRPGPAQRTRMRARLMRDMEQAEVTWFDRLVDAFLDNTRGLRHSMRVATASSLAAMMIGGTGVAVASQAAAPGDLLYGVKRLTESTRLSLAAGAVESGRLHLQFARERLEEVVENHRGMDPGTLRSSLEAMNEAALAGSRDLLEANREGDRDALTTLRAFAENQRAGLSGILDRLPTEVRSFAEESLDLLRRIHVRATDAATRCDACASAAAADGVADVADAPTAGATCECLGGELRAPDPGGVPAGRLGGLIPPPAAPDGAHARRAPDAGGDADRTVRRQPLLPGVTGPLRDVGEGLRETVEDTVGGIADGDGVSDGVGGVGENAGETVEDVGESVGDTVEDVGDTVGDLGDAVPDGTNTTTDGSDSGDVADGVEDATGQVGDSLDDATDGVTGGVDGLLDDTTTSSPSPQDSPSATAEDSDGQSPSPSPESSPESSPSDDGLLDGLLGD